MNELTKSIALGACILGGVALIAWALVGLRIAGNFGVAAFFAVAGLAICGVTGEAVRGRL